MNVNGSRFDLLLGHDDWARCLDGDGEDALPLRRWWQDVDPPDNLPAWDEQRSEITVPAVIIELPRTRGEAPLTLDARRGAAADRFGNVYWIGPTRTTLHVSASGARGDVRIWPSDTDACARQRTRERVDFVPAHEEIRETGDTYLALAVTTDDYLVVAFANGDARGFLSFDLVSGGDPVRTLWPRSIGMEPVDMAARHGGGVWVLDRTARATSRVLWELDCQLAVVSVAQPPVTLDAGDTDDFQPIDGPPRTPQPVTFPGGIELRDGRDWVSEPIAVESPAPNVVLLLDRDAAGERPRVVRVERARGEWSAQATAWLGELPDAAHDFVYARARIYAHAAAEPLLLIATSGGNQARAYTLEAGAAFALKPATELLPLRRFGGRALIAIDGNAAYDSGVDMPLWTPLVHQPRARYRGGAEFVTPVFDSHELGTTWDRVLLDACIPPGTTLDIESRAGDELQSGMMSPGDTAPVIGAWTQEPRPHLRSTGPELPWLRSEAARATRREHGSGTWELLLQHARGRYLQLRIRMSTDSGMATPRLRALRVWQPRFSYPQRFLPAVYREDPATASLLERWLANCESTLTQIEDRIVNVQALFDPRSAPAETLAWLSAWLDVALDPAWDERRQRLFIAHAMEFFRWRGTVHGLWLALELAFNECFDARAFEAPGCDADGPRRIRIVEAFQLRRTGTTVTGDSGATDGLREIVRAARWTPREGLSGLVERHAEFTRTRATPTAYVTAFPLYNPYVGQDEEKAAQYGEFLSATFGFVPTIGAAERNRWQQFHVAEYGTPARLRTRHGVNYRGFEEVSLPRDWPTPDGYAQDWRRFNTSADGAAVRTRWQDFLARRYRRIERLNAAYRTSWPGFDVVALPDALPATAAAQTDWLQFEQIVLALHRSAHRFSVLLPVADVTGDPDVLRDRLGLAQRIVELEKPAHTVFDVRFYWAMFRIDDARLGVDTLIGAGSRAPELIPAAILGRAYMGASFVAGVDRPRGQDRLLLTC